MYLKRSCIQGHGLAFVGAEVTNLGSVGGHGGGWGSGNEGVGWEPGVGLDADFVVFDPDAEWTLDEGEMHTAAGWSPYHGRAVRGRVLSTWVGGRCVFENGYVTGGPGTGRFVGREREQEAVLDGTRVINAGPRGVVVELGVGG